MRALEREAKAQRDLFESYLAKYREATARDSIAAAPADARIISRAVVSNIPFFPKKVPIVLIATLGTFSLAMAFVVTGALLSGESTARRAVADRHHAGAGTGPVPVPTPEPRRAIRHARNRTSDRLPAAANVPPPPQPAPVVGTSIDAIAASLQQAGDAGRRIAVIGAARDVGTTLTAIALARTLVPHRPAWCWSISRSPRRTST